MGAAGGGLFETAPGSGYGLLLIAANLVHTLGHMAAGRLAGSPMETNVLTSTRDVNVYREPGASAPPGRRRMRSLGGPTANLVVGVAALAAARAFGSRWALTFGVTNAAVALWTLLPLPTMDGWIVWRAERAPGRPSTSLRPRKPGATHEGARRT